MPRRERPQHPVLVQCIAPRIKLEGALFLTRILAPSAARLKPTSLCQKERKTRCIRQNTAPDNQLSVSAEVQNTVRASRGCPRLSNLQQLFGASRRPHQGSLVVRGSSFRRLGAEMKHMYSSCERLIWRGAFVAMRPFMFKQRAQRRSRNVRARAASVLCPSHFSVGPCPRTQCGGELCNSQGSGGSGGPRLPQ